MKIIWKTGAILGLFAILSLISTPEAYAAEPLSLCNVTWAFLNDDGSIGKPHNSPTASIRETLATTRWQSKLQGPTAPDTPAMSPAQQLLLPPARLPSGSTTPIPAIIRPSFSE